MQSHASLAMSLLLAHSLSSNGNARNVAASLSQSEDIHGLHRKVLWLVALTAGHSIASNHGLRHRCSTSSKAYMMVQCCKTLEM